MPLATLLGTEANVQAWLVGGYHGTWLPMPEAAGITLDNASLRRFGAIVARVMEALPDELKQYLDNVVVDVEDGHRDDEGQTADFADVQVLPDAGLGGRVVVKP